MAIAPEELEPVSPPDRRRPRVPRVRIPQRIWSPPGHWKLFAFYMLVLFAVVAFQGFATHTIGPGTEGSQAASAPLANARPVLAGRGSRLVPIAPPPGRRVALTFDDGPNPKWTPAIARELRRAGVPGTFFLIGSEAARYPGLVRTLVRDGDELGNHTFTHVFLSGVPAWEGRLQIQLTEAVISGITGHYTRLLRPPYSATPDAITPHDDRALATLAGSRYFVVLANYDSSDWQRPGVGRIVANAMPRGNTGGIVMLHDGGGNRSQTVAAVAADRREAEGSGFQLVTVSRLARLGTAEVFPAAKGGRRAGLDLRVQRPRRVRADDGVLDHPDRDRGAGAAARDPPVRAREPSRPSQPGAADDRARALGRDRRARVQRGGDDRARRPLARGERLRAVRGGRGRRRLDRPDRGDRRGDRARQRPARAPGQRRQGSGAQHRCRGDELGGRRDGRRRHAVRARHARRARPAVRRPRGRRRRRQH